VLFGLGWPEWLTIVGGVGGLLLTFWLMAKASISYERARRVREQAPVPSAKRDPGDSSGGLQPRKERA
jgi:hypothetical protein